MATKRPSNGSSCRSPLRASRRRRPVTTSSPNTSAISLFQRTSILGWASARSCMILLPRNCSRRWTSVTWLAKRVRKVASSRAVSPPPTTATCLPRKKKPSQVAQALTPRPRRRVLLSRPSQSAEAPVATMTDRAGSDDAALRLRRLGPGGGRGGCGSERDRGAVGGPVVDHLDARETRELRLHWPILALSADTPWEYLGTVRRA